MPTPHAILTIIIAAFAVGTSGASASVGPRQGPRFEDLENATARGARTTIAAGLINDVIPSGTSISEAETSLRLLGASCRRKQADHAVERCDHNGPTLIEGDLIESVYWTVALNVQDGRVTGIQVRRKVDIH